MNTLKIDLPERMKATWVTRYGGPEAIQIVDVPLPAVKPGMVLVRVAASAVNSGDVRTRTAGERTRENADAAGVGG